MSRSPVLELRGIAKSFGPVQALRGADFVLSPGEVHALLGENGAGKSTLMHIACGLTPPDRGTIRVRGAEVRPGSPRAARALGIGMVHQHFTSIGALTVRENIQLAMGRWTADTRMAHAGIANRLRQGLEANARAEDLSVAERQRLEVVKALATGASILLLDEPSAVLAPSEVEELLELVRQFSREGGAVALITHKLPEVFASADRVTVLRRGEVSFTGPLQGQTERSLAEAMIGGGDGGGGAMLGLLPGPEGRRGPDASGLGPRLAPQAERMPAPAPAAILGDAPVYRGEIVGVAAVEGNGQRALLRAVAELPGAAFIPEDRTTEGLILDLSITENVVLGGPPDAPWKKGGRIDWAAARAESARIVKEFGVSAPGTEVPVRTLSGGNQQRVVLGRALMRRPRILVAENPTRGLDIRATAEVHERLRKAAESGVAVVVYSSDLDEVLELAGRVLVVHAGRVLVPPAGADRRVVGELMLGVGAPGAIPGAGAATGVTAP